MTDIRVRFPPSPTGIPHIGNTRTALFNFLFAKHTSGKFILRIEDTDQARLVKGAEEKIYEILNWLGLVWDEGPDKGGPYGPYKQSERLDFYKKVVGKLLKLGLAQKDEGAIRFIVPKGKTVSWEDAIGNKDISFKSDDLEDFVILKSDGFPTYHLANVVDDHAMKISHIIRGDEWISSTPKHILLYEAFGWKHPIFAHLPVILGPDKTKLSKRHGAKSVLEYRDEGYLKEALLNYMALLGWNPGGDKEIFSINEMINLFDLKDVNTASPIFDSKKLEWMNGVYIRDKLSVKDLEDKLLEFNPSLRNYSKERFTKFVALAQTRMKTLAEFKELVEAFLHPRKVRLTKEEVEFKRMWKERLENLNKWDREEITNIISELFLEHATVKNFKMLYKVILGVDKGLPIANVLEILGKEESLKMFS